MSDDNANLPSDDQLEAGAESQAKEQQPTADAPADETPDAATNENATNENVTEETVTEETVTDETVTDETVAEEATADEAVAEEAATEEPVAEESAAEAEEQSGNSDTPAEPIEVAEEDEAGRMEWYILKVSVNREDYIKNALLRRVKVAGLEEYFGDVVVPTEDVAEFNRNGKRRIVKRKLYPGYIMVNMIINDDTWFLVRETPGIGDFTGSAGKPTPMDTAEVERIIFVPKEEDEEPTAPRVAIPFSVDNQVRVKDGYFQNFEGKVESIDEATGRVTVIISIFGRSTPVELQHYQIEKV